MKLCALAWDCTPEEAARQMLDQAGVADPDYREQWKRLTDWSQPADVDGLAAALRVWCSRTDPRWPVSRSDSAVAGEAGAVPGPAVPGPDAGGLPDMAGRLQEGDDAGAGMRPRLGW